MKLMSSSTTTIFECTHINGITPINKRARARID
jgi:hypothetical protein